MSYLCKLDGRRECDGCMECFPIIEDEEEELDVPFDDAEEPDYDELEED